MADLRTLHPQLVPWARWLYAVGKHNDGRLVVTSAYRSPADQQRLRDKWCRGESSIVAAPIGKSKHQLGLAFDLANVGVDPFEDKLLPALGAVWVYLGGEYGGVNDPVHFAVKT